MVMSRWFPKLVLALAIGSAFAQSSHQESAYLQNASRVMAREYRSRDVSYILMDLRTGAFINAGWHSITEPLPAGSLVKPFTALAYAESHGFRFPEQTCAGGNDCWNPAGHGRLDIVHAIAFSCNSYFSQLGEKVSVTDAASIARRFGLAGPPLTTSADGLAGRYGEWRESPRALAHAYAELLARSSQPGIRDIVRGMAESARSGTAQGASSSVPHLLLLAKTGTAPCTHANHAPGDGFVVLAWPAEVPRYLLLVRLHSAPGAQAAVLGGKMVRSLEEHP